MKQGSVPPPKTLKSERSERVLGGGTDPCPNSFLEEPRHVDVGVAHPQFPNFGVLRRGPRAARVAPPHALGRTGKELEALETGGDHGYPDLVAHRLVDDRP